MKVLIVDDEKNIRQTIVKLLELEQIKTASATNGISALRLLEEETFDAAIIDLKMPGMDGKELLKWLQEKRPLLPVIMISAFGEIKDAVEAMKLGAKDYIVKPFDPDELIIRLKNIVANQCLQNQINHMKNNPLNEIFIGESNEIIKIKKLVAKVANTPSNILISGESGTGKEILARYIHHTSNRQASPFIAINIGAVPENLLESELFGHEKGAFTGAIQQKTGMFEVAASGTLFLDEIGEMPLHLQVKLLRVLQEKKIQRLGSTHMIPVNARIICATNKDLEAEIKNGQFREDLFFRLNVIPIHLPALRERLSDIPLLCGLFIKKFNHVMDKQIKTIAPPGLEKLKSYHFPGNIRELENIIERAFIFCETDSISENDINIKTKTRQSPPPITGKLKEQERAMIREVLQRWDGNRTKAALELGINRRTLINKIKEYQLEI